MADNGAYISSLEKRVTALEQRLIGEERVREGQPSLIHLIKTIDGKLKALTRSEVVTAILNQKNEIDKFMQPGYVNSLKLTDGAKEELLICYSEQLRKIQDQVEDFGQLKDSINNLEFKGLDTKEKKVSSLAASHVKQEEEVETVTRQIQGFLDLYTKLLSQLSQECVKWDETLTTLEK